MIGKKIKDRFIPFIGMALSLIIIFWYPITSGFNFITSDMYDGAIAAIIEAHWYSYLNGHESFRTLNYFYPIKGSLGYNDAYLIQGLFASLFRFFGLDLLISSELSNIVLKVVGFYSMFYLLQRVNKSTIFNCLASMLFIIPGQNTHVQLYTICLAPLVTILFILGVDYFKSFKFKSFLFFCSSILVYVLWLLSGFYTAYFYTLFVASFFIVILFFHILPFGFISFFEKTDKFLEFLYKHKLFLFGLLFFSIICINPFKLTYFTKLHETGGWGVSNIYDNATPMIDLFNIGFGSFLWNWIYHVLRDNYSIFEGGEHVSGFPLIFLFIFFLTGIHLITKKKLNSNQKLIKIIFFLSIFWLLAITRFGNFTLWRFVYDYFPGGTSIRAINRMYVFIVFPMCIVIAYYFNSIQKIKKTFYLFLLCSLLILEQVHTNSLAQLDRGRINTIIDSVKPPSFTCETFYIVNSSWPKLGIPDADSRLGANIEAMYLAERFHIPTINGAASFNPTSDWNLNSDPKETYKKRILLHAKKYGVKELCEYDSQEKKWNKIY
jgi:hypothetical protein